MDNINYIKKYSLLIIVLLIIFIVYILTSKSGGTETELKIETPVVKQNINTASVTDLYNKMYTKLPIHWLHCIPSKKSFCSLDGCESVKAGVFILLGEDKNDNLFIARCDNNPCDIYKGDIVESGAFTIFKTTEEHGMLFKMSSLDQSFIEVVTLGTESFVTSGYCYSK